MLLRASRFYIRYLNLPGRRWLYDSFVDRHLAWRTYSTVARMRRGPSVEVELPDQIQSRIYFFGVWEPEITHYVSTALAPGDRFVDVGGNIGYFSLLAASIVGPKGAVSAVEASPTNYAALARNVARSGFNNITLHHKAVADAPGRVSIFLGPAHNRGATTTLSSVAVRKGQGLEAEVVADTLSAIVGEDELLAARLIKIDIEGAEYALLAGIVNLLPRFTPKTEWLLEMSPEAMREQGQSVDAFLDMFRSAGYELYQIRNDYSDESYFGGDSRVYLEKLTESPKKTVDILARKPARDA